MIRECEALLGQPVVDKVLHMLRNTSAETEDIVVSLSACIALGASVRLVTYQISIFIRAIHVCIIFYIVISSYGLCMDI